ncbi:MAG: PASTA domain-containing protein [Gemmatimonadaceae bacterium]
MTWRARLRRLLPYVMAVVGGFLLAFLVVAFFVFPAGVIPQDVRVPNVVGLTLSEATRSLEQRGFKAQRGEQRFHNAAPRGTVLEQDPVAETPEQTGTVVTLIVSAGQRIGTIPPVIGMTRELALNALESAGYHAGQVTMRPSNEPRGAVIDSRPRPGTQAPMPSAVALVVSEGPTTILVPDLIGRSVTDATQLLRQVGLNVGDIQYEGGGGAVADASAVVVMQTPPSGSQVTGASRVNIVVGRMPRD